MGLTSACRMMWCFWRTACPATHWLQHGAFLSGLAERYGTIDIFDSGQPPSLAASLVQPHVKGEHARHVPVKSRIFQMYGSQRFPRQRLQMGNNEGKRLAGMLF